jgi:hypothetical protein
MRLDKRIKEGIFASFSDRPVLDDEEANQIVRTFAPQPDIKLLVDQYYKRMTNRVMQQFRDENGAREILAAKASNGKTRYVFINKSSDMAQLKDIHRRLSRKYDGLKKTIKKVGKRVQIVIGQTSLVFEDQNAVNE